MAYPCFCFAFPLFPLRPSSSPSFSFFGGSACATLHWTSSASSPSPILRSQPLLPLPREFRVRVSSQALVCLRRCHLTVPSHHPRSIHALLAPGVSLARGNATLDSPPLPSQHTAGPFSPCLHARAISRASRPSRESLLPLRPTIPTQPLIRDPI